MRVDLIESDDELVARFWELAEMYRLERDQVIICPQPNQAPHPGLSEFRRHLASGFSLPCVVEDDGALKALALCGKHGISAMWGKGADKAETGEIMWALVRWMIADRGRFVLHSGLRGWVHRKWFERYVEDPGGPWDTTIQQPGMRVGETYADYDHAAWDLEAWREGDDIVWRFEAKQ